MTTEYYRKELASRMKLLRMELGMTQSDLAYITGLSRSVIQNCESEKSFLTYGNLMEANARFNEFIRDGMYDIHTKERLFEDYFLYKITSSSAFRYVFNGRNPLEFARDYYDSDKAYPMEVYEYPDEELSFVTQIVCASNRKNNYGDESKTELYQEMLEKYRRLSSYDQKRLLKQIDGILDMYKTSYAIPHKRIPLVGETACGNPIEAIAETDQFIETQELRADFALKAVGNSMSPIINDGDIILIKRTEELSPSDIGIFQINSSGFSCDEQVTCKVLKSNRDGILTLSPLNPSYDPIIVDSTKKEVKIIGKFLSREVQEE